jgi:mannose PTS system EIIA component
MSGGRRGGASLIGIVLVSHGPLAEGLKGAAEMIVGPQSRFLTVSMGAAADLDELRAQIEDAAGRVVDPSEGERALVLVDLMGGSPSNASAYLASTGTQVVCGVNLPMLLEVLMNREDMSIDSLAEFALHAGKDGIISLTQILIDAQNHP